MFATGFLSGLDRLLRVLFNAFKTVAKVNTAPPYQDLACPHCTMKDGFVVVEAESVPPEYRYGQVGDFDILAKCNMCGGISAHSQMTGDARRIGPKLS